MKKLALNITVQSHSRIVAHVVRPVMYLFGFYIWEAVVMKIKLRGLPCTSALQSSSECPAMDDCAENSQDKLFGSSNIRYQPGLRV